MDVGAAKAPRFGGAKHASSHDNRAAWLSLTVAGREREGLRNDEASVIPARHDGVTSLQNAMARGWVNIFRSNRPRFDCRLG